MRSVEAAGTRDIKPTGSVTAFRKQSVRVSPTEVDRRRSSAATNENEEEYKRRSATQKKGFSDERRQTSMKFNLKGRQPSWVADMQGPDGKIMYAFQFKLWHGFTILVRFYNDFIDFCVILLRFRRFWQVFTTDAFSILRAVKHFLVWRVQFFKIRVQIFFSFATFTQHTTFCKHTYIFSHTRT